ncbi:hypothetical protein B0J14DRAFT_567514 [Halenospora varia]|nr:hypothetical protein B0J14DRAFT_567514 [Halenospora varia]
MCPKCETPALSLPSQKIIWSIERKTTKITKPGSLSISSDEYVSNAPILHAGARSVHVEFSSDERDHFEKKDKYHAQIPVTFDGLECTWGSGLPLNLMAQLVRVGDCYTLVASPPFCFKVGFYYLEITLLGSSMGDLSIGLAISRKKSGVRRTMSIESTPDHLLYSMDGQVFREDKLLATKDPYRSGNMIRLGFQPLGSIFFTKNGGLQL